MNATTWTRQARGSSFSLGFLFLPADKRRALDDVYAYCRLIDDIVDDGRPRAQAAAQLDWWGGEVARLFGGRPTHEVTRRLLPSVERFALPRWPFDEMIRGCRMDLDAASYETIEDLESYMRGVAGSVGELAVRIFGWRRTAPGAIEGFARDFGYAFQLTNIIRDVGADLELGRVYLPGADLRRAGYDGERLRARVRDDAFLRLMRLEYERAKGYYRRARALVDPADLPSLLPAEVMAHIYEGLLDQIAARGFPVLSGKARLTP
ncbi:MAG: squalene/phytoene synthase family protein, partial [Elusimicrobia bacterium]|nr:squalene/phytoene synthase family protein [Elusimicrobiota bacterium]